ncbi:hypothetical protein NDN08_007471 [Rhodosorus marinus]|uniref:Cyclin N-terminal domain-containing protein n=1 Tax=Rhodosorus marinus TaxID=101924 RepID=A0AAV8V1W1_9RHOD|nr:hypothetical protein NDN08_007471 [Rhodosorus marinus]
MVNRMRVAREVERRSDALAHKLGGRPGIREERKLEQIERIAVACGLTRLLEWAIQRNSVEFTCEPRMVDPALMFYSSAKPNLSLKLFVFKLFKYLNCSLSVFTTALVLMDRLVKKGNHYRLNEYNVHRIFLATSLIACKLLDDKPRPLKLFAMVGGISPTELCALEKVCLETLEYDLYVNPAVYALYERRLRASVHPQISPAMMRRRSRKFGN